MSRLVTAQVVHGLAILAEEGLLAPDHWPGIATMLSEAGFRWPALTDLMKIEGYNEHAVIAALTELAAQIEPDLGDGPRLDPWDAVAGLYGRAWRLDLLDATLAVWRMDQVWFHAREFERRPGGGVDLMWSGMGVKEMDDGHSSSASIERLAEAVLADADALLPADALEYALCRALRAAFDANGY